MRKLSLLIIFLLVIVVVIIGRLNNPGKHTNRFAKKQEYQKNITVQRNMNEQTLKQLYQEGVAESFSLEVVAFFYSGDYTKAKNLRAGLEKQHYHVEITPESGKGDADWKITCFTTPMKMDLAVVNNWTTLMCKLGYENDCEFDGWEASPDQIVEPNLTADDYYNQSLGFYDEKRLQKAELYMNASIKLDPAFSDSYYNRALIRTDLGKTTLALEDYTKAIELNPNDVSALINRGAMKDEMQDYNGAIKDYNTALKINPAASDAYLNRGNSKYNKGDDTGACADWKKAAELGDEQAKTMLNSLCK